jgi:TIR domain
VSDERSRIFISYRRDDTQGYARALHDELTERFGRDRVFRDIDTLRPGEDFVDAIEQAIGSSKVVVALIGGRWLSSTDPRGKRRIDKTDDYIRVEIGAALRENLFVIPVLVQGAVMPRLDELPEDLSRLARRNAFELSDSRWEYDVGRLIEVLESRMAVQAAEHPLEQGPAVPLSESPAASEKAPRRIRAPKPVEKRIRQSALSEAKPAVEPSRRVARVKGKPGGDPRWATVAPLLAGVLFLGYLVLPVSEVNGGLQWVTTGNPLGALPLIAAIAFVSAAALLRTPNRQRQAFLNGLILASGLLVLALATADLLSFAEHEFCGFTEVSVVPLLAPWSGAAGALLSIVVWHRRKATWPPTEVVATGRRELVRAALAGGAAVLIVLATVALETCAGSSLVETLLATAIPPVTLSAIAAWSAAAFLRPSSGSRSFAIGVAVGAGTGGTFFFLSLAGFVNRVTGIVPEGTLVGVLAGLLLVAAGWPRWTQRPTS